MSGTLRLLLVEDDEPDAALITRHLRRDGIDVDAVRVDTELDFRKALTHEHWDLIIADYTQPAFSGLRALQIYSEHRLDIPFVIISGTVGEEVAVEAMRAGAHDYLLKDKLTRLGPLVRRELRDSQARAERRQAEASLRESEERFRLLVENTTDLITEVSVDGTIRYVSPNHEQILGFKPQELVGRSLYSLVHPEDQGAIIDRFSQHDGTTVAYRVHDKNQVLHWFESSGRAFRTSSGEERIVIITRDATERIAANEKRAQLEAQLRQSQKMEAIGTLAGGIAHDFNNILTGIIGNIQLSQLEPGNASAVATALNDALNASNRARDLVAQILTFSRRHEQRRAVMNLGSIINEALRLLRASLPASIEIKVRIPDPCPSILCEPTQIHQIVMNLGTNAAHAMPNQTGELTVAVDRVFVDVALRVRHPQLSEGVAVRLTVADNGKGMSPQVVERIFEPFFTTKPIGEGTGLGLAVVHGIVQSHDSAITVESTPGKGTTFQVYFPATEGIEAAPAPQADATPKGKGQRVYLVDDEPGVVSLGTRMLEKLGYRPVPFSQAAAALEAIRKNPKDVEVLITDLAMPGLSGLDIARQLLALNPNAAVVVSTGMMRALDRENAAQIGIRHAINKPFTFSDFATTLHEAILAKQAPAAGT